MLGQDFDYIQNMAIPTFQFRSGGRTEPISRIIPRLLPYLFAIAGIILILNIIVSGYQLMTSAGDPKAAESAKGKITTSVIGIIIILISFWLVSIIMKFFGIDFTTPIII